MPPRPRRLRPGERARERGAMRTTEEANKRGKRRAAAADHRTAPPVARSSGVVVGLPRRGTCMRTGCGRRLPRWGGGRPHAAAAPEGESRVAPYGISRWGTARRPVPGKARRPATMVVVAGVRGECTCQHVCAAPPCPGRGLFLPANVSRCRGFSRTARTSALHRKK